MNKFKLLLAISIILSFAFVACNSSKTGDENDPGAETIFVATDTSIGTIVISIKRNPIPVAETGDFSVNVRDADGRAVPGTLVECDTEADLVIIEPNTGGFITNSFGSASGIIGCEDTGSFIMGCRLPGGGNKREFVQVKCEGDRPVGFSGFPDAGGGTLGEAEGGGGGVSDTGSDDPEDGFTVRITEVSIEDTGGGSGTPQIDIVQDGDCDDDGNIPPDGTIDPEPFGDAFISFTVKNNTEQIARITSFTYSVSNFDGTGATFNSSRIDFIGEATGIDAGATGTFRGLFIDAGTGGKFFFGSSTPITSDGFKNVTYSLRGTLADGTPVTVTASDAISFDNFNRC